MKTLQELINREEPGWDLVQEWLNQATNSYEILPKDTHRAETELVATQVTTRSPMGGIIFETGGILIDNGWLRILGSGGERLRGISQWNQGKTFEKIGDVPSFFLIADDVLGGYFAINGGALGQNLGKIYYFAQDTLQWEDLNLSYSDFLTWAFCGNLQQFYEPFRWEGWQQEVKQMSPNSVFSFFPFLWSKEGKDFSKTKRSIVSIDENYAFTTELAQQMNGDANS